MKTLYTKIIILSLLSFLATGLSFGQIIISQYYEGASNDKWIELTNVGSTTVDLTSPQLYLALFANSAADNPSSNSPNNSETLTGTIAAGSSILFKNSSASLPSYASGTNSSTCNFNGDDLLIITSSTGSSAWNDRTDVVGNGNSWGSNTSFYRNSTITSGNISFTLSEWTEVTNTTVNSASAGTSERLGEHSFSSTSSPGITLGAVSGSTTEAGGTATFSVVLDAEPTDDVVLNVTSGDTGEVTVAPLTLTFTNANWDTPQNVTATGQDDILNDGDVDVTITISVDDAASDDDYDPLADLTIIITNEDDDPFPLPFTEDFATGLYAVTQGGVGSDGTEDYFFITDGTNIDKTYTGATGNFFAGQDIDDGGWTDSASPSQLTWEDIDISSISSIDFSCDFASVGGGIDAADSLLFEYRVDGGSWNNIIAFENTGGSNNDFLEDTNFDGTGDGIQLTSAFSTFTKNIAVSGSSLDIRFTADINSGDEEFAIDNLIISESCTAPADQATSYSTTNLSTTSATLNWTRGTPGGGDNVLVVVKEGSAVDSDPISGTAYTADTTFSNGDEIGTGNFVVYNGSNTDVVITGLNSNTTYHVAVFEYNNTDACYLTPGLTGSFTTLEPNINLTGGPITGLDYFFDSGPSNPQSFNISGTNLDGSDVIINAPTDFEISDSETGTYSSSITLTTYDGTTDELWVRLETGKSNDTYTGNITISGGGDTSPPTLALSGEVTAAPPANDDCGNAIALVNNDPAISGTLEAATEAAPFIGSGKDVWYSITPTYDETYTITLSNFSGDADLYLYDQSNSCPTTTTDIASSTTTSATESISEILTSGTTYYISVVAYDAAAENTFDIEVTAPPETTRVNFANASTSVNEGDGTVDIDLTITNEDATNATSVDVALTTGDAADIDNYTTQTLTFPAGSSANQTLTITLTDDALDEADETLTFTLQNISGGNNAQIGTQNTFDLTIEDNDLPSAAIPYNEDFSDCATQEWSVFTVGAETEWSCGSGYFEANAFGSSGAADDYLVSPAFDMDAQTGETLTFTSWTRFQDVSSPQIELLYTDNFTGDPATTTWNSSLNPTWPAPDSQTNTGSGNVDVSGITGTAVHFAFRYTSTGTSGGTTEAWRIEDFDISTASTSSITLSETSLSGLDYVDGSGPSAEQTFTAEGSNLSDDITLTAPADFEISTTSGSGFGSSVSLTQTGGTVATTDIYVRLAAGLSVNTYSGTLTATSTGATQQDVSLSGEVTASGGGTACGVEIDFETQGVGYSTSITEFSDGSGDYFTQTDGTNISSGISFNNTDGSFFAAQDIDGEGASLPVELTIDNIDISTLTNLEFSIDLAEDDDGSNEDWDAADYVHIFYSIDGGTEQNLLWIESSGGTNTAPAIDTNFDGVGDGIEITDTFATFTESIGSTGSSMDIRIEFSLNSGDEDIALDNISVCGTSGTPTPTIVLSETTLSGLDYVNGSGPSAEQTFTAEGSNLTDDITLTAPADFEISTTSGSGFGPSVNLTQTGGTVATTDIYVRLAAGLSVNTYSGTLAATSPGAIQQDVSLSGEVTATSCAGTSTTFPFNGVSGSTNLEHTTSNPPLPTGDESCGTNYLIYYDTAPSTDVSTNFLRSNTTDDLIESEDWGGEGKFETFAIDVSGETSVDIETFGNTTNSGFNAGGEEFQWWYTLDGGTQTNLGSAISGTGSLAVGPTTIDVTGVNEIIVGFTFNMNGGSDGFEDVDVTVIATPTAPEVGFDTASSTENETNATFTVNIPVTLSNFSSNVDLSVTVDGSSTAEAGDYTLNTTSLSFTGNGTQNISLDINPDPGFDDETIILEIAETTSTGITITTSQHTVTVVDDETAPLGWQITAENTDFIIDFDNTVAGVNNGQFNGSGFTPTPSAGQLNSEAWKSTGMSDGDTNFGDTETSGDFARGSSTGGVTTGGFYAFETSTADFSLGVQPIGSDFTPGTITLRAQNQTGVTVTDIDISYILYVLNNEARGNSFNFSYSTDDSTYTPVGSLDFTSGEAADSSPAWVSNNQSASISSLSIADGEYFYLRWESDDDTGGGSRDEFSIDDITVNFNPSVTVYTYDNGWNTNPIGVSTLADDIEVINGTAAISGTLVGNNLTISSGATLELDFTSILELDGDITNDGTILFKSDSNGTAPATRSAQIDTFTGTISGSGEVTIERYITERRAFRLLASPVTTTDFIYENWQENGSTPTTPDGLGTHITGGAASLGFDQSGSNNPSMFTFNNANQDWDELLNTNATKLNAETPYLTMVRGDRSINLFSNSSDPTETTLRATGELFTGTSTPNLSSGVGSYSLVANPYQAVIDYSLTTRSDLTDFIYVWDVNAGGAGGRGAYVTVDLNNGDIDPPSGNATKFIAPGTSFFVQNTFSTTPSLTINEDDKATAENQVAVFSNNPMFYINSRLYLTSDLQNGNTEKDAVGLRFSSDFTTPGSLEDGSKLTNPDENYAVMNDGIKSIDKQNLPTDGHSIELYVDNFTATDYSLTYDIENKPEDINIVLVDAYLGTQTELTDNFIYNFSVDSNIPESIATDRFSLIFNQTTFSTSDNEFGSEFSLYPNPTQNGVFNIKTPNISGEVNVEISSLLGQQVYKQTLSVEAQEVNVNASKLSSGLYMVKLTQDGQSFTTKLMVE